MGALRALVLTASIDDENGVRQWVDSVGKATAEVQAALNGLRDRLADAPHISITLRQHAPDDAKANVSADPVLSSRECFRRSADRLQDGDTAEASAWRELGDAVRLREAAVD